MIGGFGVIPNHFSTGLTHCSTQSLANMLYLHLSLPCMPTILEGVADLQKEWTCKHYTDERTTAYVAMNGWLEDWQYSNME